MKIHDLFASTDYNKDSKELVACVLYNNEEGLSLGLKHIIRAFMKHRAFVSVMFKTELIKVCLFEQNSVWTRLTE